MSPNTKERQPVIYSILDSPAYGGAEEYVLSNLYYFAQVGYPVVLATNNSLVKTIAQSIIQQRQLDTFSIISFPFVLDAIGNWKGLIKFFIAAPIALLWQGLTFYHLRKKHKDIFCYWAGFSDRLLLSPIASLFCTKIIWIEFGPLEPTFKKNFGFPKQLYQLMQRLPQKIITISQYTRTSIVKNSNISHENITIIYPGIQLNQPMTVPKHTTSPSIFTVCYVGRLAEESEIALLIQAFDIFHNNFHEKSRLVVMGDGPQKKELMQLSESTSSKNDIIFTGFVSQDQKYKTIANANAFIFPRAWTLEGFGISTIEGMGMGVPTIAPNFGPQKEIITHKYNGLLFEPHNAPDLAEKLFELARSPHLQRSLALAGKQTVERKFSIKRMHAQTAKVISQL